MVTDSCRNVATALPIAVGAIVVAFVTFVAEGVGTAVMFGAPVLGESVTVVIVGTPVDEREVGAGVMGG